MNQRCDEVLDRDLLISYSFLQALDHYYPSRSTVEVRGLLERFAWVREKEPSRLLRQRRIALDKILKELCPRGAT